MTPAVAARAEPQTVDAVQLFALAEAARSEGRLADAEAMYRALINDSDVELRSEAGFRLGMLLADQHRYPDAALAFRALLDEKPDASRVRIELAQVLARIGDEAAARRELRQAQAAGLPPDVALVVDQFAGALRARKPFGGSLSIGIAPDTNINRATDAETLDTIIAPLDLSEDAQQQSGVGLRMGGQAYGRLPLSARITLLSRLSGQTELYRQSRFNDMSASLLLGLELRLPRTRLQPALGATWRRYGKQLYARTESASVNWVQMAGSRGQLDTDFSVSRADYIQNDLQDGWLYDFSTSYERSFDARSGGSLLLSLNRHRARDPGYSTAAGGAGLLYWRELGGMTLFGSAGIRRLEADERLFLFPAKRREWLYRFGIGGTLRQMAVAGFAPLVRANFERNRSSVGIYDYRRTSLEFGITRAF